MSSLRLVLAAAAAASASAGLFSAIHGCALANYEVGTAAPDGAAEVGSRPDAAHHTHDASTKPDAKPPVDAPPTAATCTHKTYPPPPSGADVQGEGTFTLAVRSIDLGESDTNPPGYDLDNTCTCIDDGGPSCVSPQQHCDSPGGVDNGALALIKLFQSAQPAYFGSIPFSQMAEAGDWSLLLEISGYGTTPDGGVADDPSVQLDVFASSGSVNRPPAWNDNDSWKVAASSVGDGGIATPRYSSPGAYVANHVLVAALPEIELVISGGTMQTFSIKLTDGFVTGTLNVVGGKLQINDGVIAARWAMHDIFESVSSYRTNTGSALCTNSFVYSQVKENVCAGLDILATSTVESLPCDALSMGIGFTAFPILPLATLTPPTMPSGACPVGTDPANDVCPLDAGP